MAIFKKRGKYWVSFRGADGKRHRQPVGPSHALAKEVLAKKQAEAAEQKFFPARATNATLFSEIAEKYWKLHGPKVRARTWRYVSEKLLARFGERKTGQITSAEVQAYLNEIIGRGKAASTANKHLTLLTSIFNKAKKWGDFHGDSPCEGVEKFREPNHRLRFLSRQEIERLMEAACPRVRPILACAIMTGMRKGELLALRWENVDLERGLIHILVSKSGRSRQIPIDALRPVLLGLEPQPSGSVFNLPEIMFRRYFEKARNDAGLAKSGPDKVTIHTLRHTFASHFIMATGDLVRLQHHLGHSTPNLTLRYAHLSPAHLATGMAKFEATMPLAAIMPGQPAVPQSRQITGGSPAVVPGGPPA